MRHLLFPLLFLIPCLLKAQTGSNNNPAPLPKTASGSVERIEQFSSVYVKPRTVDIWLPDNYSEEQQYAVLYMHDGQMLFDANSTWNKTEWEVDEHVGQLSEKRRIKDCIVVGIWNISEIRYQDYFPQKTVNYLPEAYRTDFLKQFPDGLSADNYLKFIVNELKPYIDEKYATHTDAENTVMMGSSMGGLISLYAVCEYPEVFGRVACLSIHSLMIASRLAEGEDDAVPAAFRAYLKEHLPEANSRRIYMDFGDQTLDARYRPYQERIDEVMREQGWTMPWWQTRFFPGTDHSEISWAARLDIPLIFLLGK